MTMSPPAPPEPTLAGRVASSVGVFGIFSLVGPAIGGLFAFALACAAVLLLGNDPEAEGAVGALPKAASEMGMLFIAAAYAFGGVQAVLTGAWLGFATWRRGTFSRWLTVLAAVVASLVWIAVIYSPIDPLGAGDTIASTKVRSAVQIALALTPVGVTCALVCRWLCHKLGLVSR